MTEKTPASDLCGAGVAYALIRAIADVLGLSDEIRRYVPLVTVGTLGDAVALTGDNRILVKYGMEHLTKLGWTGLNMLVDKISGGKEGKITSTFILFYLVPKLNAAGRLGNADRAISSFDLRERRRSGEPDGGADKREYQTAGCRG